MSILDEVVLESPETGGVSDKGTEDFEAIRKRIFGGRNKSTKRKTTRPAVETEDVTQKELEEIFAGENWEEVSALYFNSRFAITGWDGFLLTDAQKKTLGLSLATTMKMLLKIDPGYIALIVFTANFGGLIAQKEVVYSKLKKESERISGKAAS